MDAKEYEEIKAQAVRSLGPYREMPVLNMNMAAIGDRLVKLIAASSMLGHAEPANTLCYVHVRTPETEFVRDALQMSTKDLVEKWFSGDGFSGQEGASRLASFFQARQLLGLSPKLSPSKGS